MTLGGFVEVNLFEQELLDPFSLRGCQRFEAGLRGTSFYLGDNNIPLVCFDSDSGAPIWYYLLGAAEQSLLEKVLEKYYPAPPLGRHSLSPWLAPPTHSKVIVMNGILYGIRRSFSLYRLPELKEYRGERAPQIIGLEVGGFGYSISNGDFGPGLGSGLVVGHDRGVSVILPGTGPGEVFRRPIELPNSNAIGTVAVLDWNGDNRSDVVGIFRDARQLKYWINRGDGTFTSGVVVQIPDDVRSDAAVTADIDHDGRTDLLIQGFQSIIVYLGKAASLMGQPVVSAISIRADLTGLSDLDNDGNWDAIAQSDSGILSLFRGRANGSFEFKGDFAGSLRLFEPLHPLQLPTMGRFLISPGPTPGMLLLTPLMSDWRTRSSPGFSYKGRIIRASLEDLNQDGRADAILSGTAGLVARLQTQSGLGSEIRIAASTEVSIQYVTHYVADWNGDGKNDIAYWLKGLFNMRLYLRLGLGQANFAPPLLLNEVVRTTPEPIFELSAVDWNGDGRLDLIFSNGVRLEGVANLGSAGWSSPKLLSDYGFASRPMLDWDGDGYVDIFESQTIKHPNSGAEETEVAIRRGLPSGGFGEKRVVWSSEDGTQMGIFAVLDLNSDGKLEILLGGQSGAMVLWREQNLLQHRKIPFANSSGPSPLPCDLEGDGQVDLLTPLYGTVFRNAMASPYPRAELHPNKGNPIATQWKRASDASGVRDQLVYIASALRIADYEVESLIFPMLAISAAPKDAIFINLASGSVGNATGGMLISLFGSGFASGSAAAPSPAYEVKGARMRVNFQRGFGLDALLTYVGPNQVNAIVPTLPSPLLLGGTNNVSFTLTNSEGHEFEARGYSFPASPGLFASPDSWALGQLVRVRGDSRIVQSLIIAEDQKLLPLEITIPEPDEELYLTLYGTGFGQKLSQSAFRLELNGQVIPIQYAGPQGGFLGLDQLNLQIPRALIRPGKSEIQLKVATQASEPQVPQSNAVYLWFR